MPNLEKLYQQFEIISDVLNTELKYWCTTLYYICCVLLYLTALLYILEKSIILKKRFGFFIMKTIPFKLQLRLMFFSIYRLLVLSGKTTA